MAKKATGRTAQGAESQRADEPRELEPREIIRQIKKNLKGIESLQDLPSDPTLKAAEEKLRKANDALKNMALAKLKKTLDELLP